MQNTTTPLPELTAAIHIGASSISLLVLTKDQQHVDFLEQSAPIARDIFSKNKLTRRTIERCVRIIQGYLRNLKELGMEANDHNTRLVATNILSEASNKDIALNRIRIACGIHIDILDDGEMTRLIYLKTRRRLQDTPSMRKRDTLVLHVGPGNTRAILFQKGQIEAYSSYRLGTHRTIEAVDSILDQQTNAKGLIIEHVSAMLESIQADYQDQKIKDIILIGYEIQHISPHIDKIKNSDSLCSKQSLTEHSEQTDAMTQDQIVSTYQLDYHTAEALVPALHINLAITELLGIKNVHIPTSTYERGILQDLFVSPTISEEYSDEVLRSATAVAEKYRVNNDHAHHVSKLCLELFEQTQDLHHLTKHDRLLLHCAAILHESGGFISSRAHHKHSYYIIRHSEIFGLSTIDIELIALTARYHRNSEPKLTHIGYRNLSDSKRMRLNKLAALLRVADALDRRHSSRVQDITTTIDKDKFIIRAHGINDANVERLAMQSKGNLFEHIFGLEIQIKETPTQAD